MQTSHTMNALLSPHRIPIHQPDIAYRTRLAAYSARDATLIDMEIPCTNDKTNKQRIHNIRFQPGSTAFMHIPDPLPCNDIFGNRSNGMPCVLYLLAAKRLIVQIEHRYVGIGHCNRPGSIQRKMRCQAVHSLSHIVPACTHGITIAAVRQPELRQKINQNTGCIPGVYRKNDTQSVDFHQSCGYRALLQAINNADSSIMRSLCKQFCNPARVSGCGKIKYHRQYVLPTKVMI